MIGRKISQYCVKKEIGRGGMGTVYEAHHEAIPNLRAAIKVLFANQQDGNNVERFECEARALSAVQDAGLVQLRDFGRLEDGTFYISMEFLEGETLAQRLERGRLRPRLALNLCRQIAVTLMAIHKQQILHRDLKPANIYIVRDSEVEGGERTKLLDFGIAKILAPGQRNSTGPGQTMGTPQYMSPEQFVANRPLTEHSDVYQLGLVFYEMLVGVSPFEVSEDSQPVALYFKHLNEKPRQIRHHLPGAPLELDKLVSAMLAKDPRSRPLPADVAGRLRSIIENLGVAADSTWSTAPAATPTSADTLTPAAGVDLAELEQRAIEHLAPSPSEPPSYELGSLEPGEVANLHSHSAHIPPRPLTRLVRSLKRYPVVAGAAAMALCGAFVSSRYLPHKMSAQTDSTTVQSAMAGSSLPPVPYDKLPTQNAQKPEHAQKLEVRQKEPVPKRRGMEFIAGGHLVMGLNPQEVEAARKECLTNMPANYCKPQQFERQLNTQNVYVAPFHLDAREVTNEDYVGWLNDNIAMQNLHLKTENVYVGKSYVINLDKASGIQYVAGKFQVREGCAKKPVVYVTWDGAEGYCAALGMRLPTEAEWEFAARGEARHRYPWGNDAASPSNVTFSRPGQDVCGSNSGPREVGYSTQDRTPEGIYDLGGNVQEWTYNVFEQSYPLDCSGKECRDLAVSSSPFISHHDAEQRSLRGGHWGSGAYTLQSAFRWRLAPNTVARDIGFRCGMPVRVEKS